MHFPRYPKVQFYTMVVIVGNPRMYGHRYYARLRPRLPESGKANMCLVMADWGTKPLNGNER